MDPQVGASFIPKKPLGEAGGAGGAFGFFFLIALLFFVASIVAAGAAFAYGGILNKTIADKSASLDKAQGAFDLPSIQDLLRIDARMRSARIIMDKHTAPSQLFSYLGENTLAAVQFTSFAYNLHDDGTGDIALDGQAGTFSDVALQSDAFGSGKILKDVIFSGITVGQSGVVTFTVKATIAASFLPFSRTLSNAAAATTTTP